MLAIDPAIATMAATMTSDPAIATTAQGAVRGVVLPHARRWLGIPFAEPPVGALRWQAPRTPHKSWHPVVREATRFGHNCLQSGKSFDMGWPQPRSTLSEDCLTLNIYAGRNTTARPAPVMMWLFGGGFVGGGGNETRLNGTWDAAMMRGDLVIVTSNYRLGAFGFAASSALSKRESAIAKETRGTGNYGIHDQRAAMQWVRANIAAFGGDPERVLLVGQSAGAFSVSQHLVRPKSWGLFSAAGMESGAFYNGFSTPTVASLEGSWSRMVEAAGCTDAAPDPTKCMVALDADRLLNLTDFTRGGVVWGGPVIDGVDLIAPEPTLARQGRMAAVPVLAGGTDEDLTAGFGSPCTLLPLTCTRSSFHAAAKRSGLRDAEADELAALYASDPLRPGTHRAQRWAYAIKHAGADAWSNCAARRAARWAVRAGQRAYWYKWSYIASGPNGKALSHHSVEQPFLFHVLHETPEEAREDGGKYEIGSGEAAFSAELVRTWAAMAATGDPNARGASGGVAAASGGGDAGGLHWPEWNASRAGSALLIEGGAGVPGHFALAANYLQRKCDLFDAAFNRSAPGV